jgi:hypothetical protein
MSCCVASAVGSFLSLRVLGWENTVLEVRTDGALGGPRTAPETVRWCKKFPALQCVALGGCGGQVTD